jgi:glutamate dehydrogenase
VSLEERRRLFHLPRSSWADYDEAMISAGGGVHPRSAKSVLITPQVRQALGMSSDVTHLTPAELIHSILRAPVDLLWNGGIGTYVKATDEPAADVGDKSNDAVRVDGRQLACRVVGEGGNLGLTQRGRIEAAHAGVRLNTDAVDNSAGVDTSDHEVNLKILLDEAVREGDLTGKQRDLLLAEMTDEVAGLVLRDNYEQNVLLGNARIQTSSMLPVHRRFVRELEREGRLDREVEFLPSDSRIEEMLTAGEGLTSPELCVLLAYSKLSLVDSLDSGGFADEEWAQRILREYFPPQVQERFGERIVEHKLRREIVTTMLANDMINRGGITFAFRAREETSADAAAIARAYWVTRQVFDLPELWAEIEALDNRVPTRAQALLLLEVRRLLDRATRWFLQNRSGSLDVEAEVARFVEPVRMLRPSLPEMLRGAEVERLDRRTAEFVAAGAPEDLAKRVAVLLDVFGLLDVVQVAHEQGEDPTAVAHVYFALSERYEVDRLLLRVTALPRSDRWAALARFALRYDIYTALAGMLSRVLHTSAPEGTADERITAWEADAAEAVARTRAVLAEVAANDAVDIAPVSVALRVLRNLVRSS